MDIDRETNPQRPEGEQVICPLTILFLTDRTVPMCPQVTATPTSAAECCRASRRPSYAGRHPTIGIRLQPWLLLARLSLLPINCAGCGAVFCSTIDTQYTEVMGGC
jgi:hypothetical protein